MSFRACLHWQASALKHSRSVVWKITLPTTRQVPQVAALGRSSVDRLRVLGAALPAPRAVPLMEVVYREPRESSLPSARARPRCRSKPWQCFNVSSVDVASGERESLPVKPVKDKAHTTLKGKLWQSEFKMRKYKAQCFQYLR